MIEEWGNVKNSFRKTISSIITVINLIINSIIAAFITTLFTLKPFFLLVFFYQFTQMDLHGYLSLAISVFNHYLFVLLFKELCINSFNLKTH